MNLSIPLENQLLVTKFYVPVPLGPLISRPRLIDLLNESMKHALTLVSAAAGFGKTTLLASWCQSLPVCNSRVAWVSLEEEDNNPRLFWTYVLTALNRQLPERFTPLLVQLQSPQVPPLKYLLITFINLLLENTERFILILDDYQVITEPQIHTALAYLIEHLPAQLRIIVATRADPPLPLPLLRAHKQAMEIRVGQLRCTREETKAFFEEVMGISLPDETIQEVMVRMEGWLVGLQLLGLSLPERVDPLTMLKEISGDQHYILDYLTEEILRRQPQEVQTFLLYTSILEQLSAPLCDAIMEQHGSEQLLQWLDQANLFIVSLDSTRTWYRYHTLFAEALRYHLGKTHADLVPLLHYRASLWYAQHNQVAQAILHALDAHQWLWAADLIEQRSAQWLAMTWGASKHELTLLQNSLEQLPEAVLGSRPRLCLACVQLLWDVAPRLRLQVWLDTAEATLTAWLTTPTHEEVSATIHTPKARQELENLLAEVIAWHALLQSYEDGYTALSLGQRALALLPGQNFIARTGITVSELFAYYSSVNDTVAAIQSGLQACSFAQVTGHPTLIIGITGNVALHMLGTGRLHEAQWRSKQAMEMGTKQGGVVISDVGFPSAVQAEILREWNQLDAAQTLAREAVSLCEQNISSGSLIYLLCGYAILLRVSLSCGELDAARFALQQIGYLGRDMSQPPYLYNRSHFTIIDQIRLWLACGELDRATRWAKELDLKEQQGTPFACEREEVARVRVLLAQKQPDGALLRLESVLQRATAGQRWGHVIESRLLQALAHQMLHNERQALGALSEAVRLGEPEGYVRSFVDEGVPMEALLYQLRKRGCRDGPTPYLDTLLTAFQQERRAGAQGGEPSKAQRLPEPLSKRELEVLQLIARGASNAEIAQELVITVDTVKRHVSHILSKLGVKNRVQIIRQARELGLLDEEH